MLIWYLFDAISVCEGGRGAVLDQGPQGGVTDGCEGQRVVLAGWGALGSVQILHKHLLELYGQGCVCGVMDGKGGGIVMVGFLGA